MCMNVRWNPSIVDELVKQIERMIEEDLKELRRKEEMYRNMGHGWGRI